MSAGDLGPACGIENWQQYYEGVFFRTTNRAENLGEALLLRIHVTINYPSLCKDSKTQNMAAGPQAGLCCEWGSALSSAEVDLNGRQIKQVPKTVQNLGRSQQVRRKNDQRGRWS